jgi:hypothetical protein
MKLQISLKDANNELENEKNIKANFMLIINGH